MSEKNPSGNIPDTVAYKYLVIFTMVVSLVVAIKRVWLGLSLGRVTFGEYRPHD
jgi:hypothetical protein